MVPNREPSVKAFPGDLAGDISKTSATEEIRSIPETLLMAFKDNLVRIRKAKGWTQQRLADQAGISLGLVKRYEAGGAAPNLPTLRRVAESLAVSTDELVFEPGGLPAKRLDRDLLERFEAVARLPDAERDAVKFLLDAVIANQELKHLLRNQTDLKTSNATKR